MSVGAWVGRHPLWSIWLLALAVRVGYFLVARPDPLNMIDSREYEAMARDLLAGHGLVEHIGFVRPPLYPLFVAGMYALGGLLALQVAQFALSATTAVLIGVLARALSARPGADVAAALVAAVYPWFPPLVGGLASETLFTFLAVLAFVVMLQAVDEPRLLRAAGAGALFGIACLARANLLFLAPPFFFWWWWRARSRARAVLFALGVTAALLPFTVYNLAQGNGLVIASSGGGMSFLIGNNPDMARLYTDAFPDDEWRRQNRMAGWGPGAQRLQGCPEVRPPGFPCGDEAVPASERELFYYQAGLRYIREQPSEWATTAARKALHYWRPWVDPRVHSPIAMAASGFSFAAVATLALLGLRRMRRSEVAFVVIVALGTTLSVVLYMVQLRYRFALLDPVLIAALGARLARRVAARPEAAWAPTA